ncbi:hypothetical protein [uncultured Dubosiella sp.]|uniref:hypothetical protein n=1 Tax=uncultured Dubosiella sp. TaxID=1937011 RepID=UPI002594172A|nr:hypothetical protein [uncultured Dubosiella sp.]
MFYTRVDRLQRIFFGAFLGEDGDDFRDILLQARNAAVLARIGPALGVVPRMMDAKSLLVSDSRIFFFGNDFGFVLHQLLLDDFRIRFGFRCQNRPVQAVRNTQKGAKRRGQEFSSNALNDFTLMVFHSFVGLLFHHVHNLLPYLLFHILKRDFHPLS